MEWLVIKATGACARDLALHSYFNITYEPRSMGVSLKHQQTLFVNSVQGRQEIVLELLFS